MNFFLISNLRSLEKFSLFADDNNANLQTIISRSIRELKIKEVCDSDYLEAVSVNCPNVRKLTIYTSEDVGDNDDDNHVFNECLMFGKLEILEAHINLTRNYKISSELNLKNLTSLFLSSFDKSFDLTIFFQNCTNLEIFSTEKNIDWKILKCILQAPKLRALCLRYMTLFDTMFLDTMKENGRNLNSFHIGIPQNYDCSVLRDELKEQFPLFREETNFFEIKILMRKTNEKARCCD
jgi:hypothetical protein